MGVNVIMMTSLLREEIAKNRSEENKTVNTGKEISDVKGVNINNGPGKDVVEIGKGEEKEQGGLLQTVKNVINAVLDAPKKLFNAISSALEEKKIDPLKLPTKSPSPAPPKPSPEALKLEKARQKEEKAEELKKLKEKMEQMQKEQQEREELELIFGKRIRL